MKPYWLAYIFGGNYRWGWRPSLYQHVRRYYREGWRASGYTLTDWVLDRPTRYFRGKSSLRTLAKKAH